MCNKTPTQLGSDPDLSVVIVNYNSVTLLSACLAALDRATDCLAVETIVVDNGSSDGSLDWLKRRGQRAKLVPLPSNAGFSRASNAGLCVARGRYYLLLNSDCFVRQPLLVALIRTLQAHPEAAAVGPRLYNQDGTGQPSCHNFPTPLVLLLEQSLLWHLFRHVPVLNKRLYIARDPKRAGAVDWLTGACLLLRADAVTEIGGLDEDFFFYWEEADLCWRLRQRGWSILFDPTAEAIHIGGGSSTNPALRMQFFKSLYLFYTKHYPRSSLTRARLIVRFMALFKAGRAGLRWMLFPRRRRRRAAAAAEAWSWLGVMRL